jgi:hypothetical protein
MGQEINYCSVCGVRVRSADFDRGDAVRRDAAAYCRACAAQAGIPAEPPRAARESRNTTRRIAVASSTSTGRIPIATPRRATEAVRPPSVSPALVWGGGLAVGGLIALAAAMALGLGSSRPAAPELVVSRPPVPAPIDAAKPAAPSSEATELASLDRRVAEAVSREKFRAALELLESERKRHDSPEWTAAVERSVAGVDAAAKKLYQDLQATMDAARRRGADGEARALADRIAAWGLPAYPPLPDSTPAPAPVPAAAVVAAPPTPDRAPEPGAAVPAPAPAPAAPALPKAAPIPFVAGPMKWSVLTPLRATGSQGSRLTILEDGSILAEGDVPAQERYSVWVQTDLKGVNAIRLEVLPDPSLPNLGPGRPPNGNFVLSEFQVQALPDAKAESGTPVVIEKAATEHSQDGFPIAHAIDGRNDTGWAILPCPSRAHDAIFDLRAPLSSPALLIVLDQMSIYEKHLIGRFRLSASLAKGASSEIGSRPPPSLEQGPIDDAIRRGVDWLKKSGSPGWESGNPGIGRIPNCDELLLLTFLHSGVPESDPRFQQLLTAVLAAPYTHTYPVAIRAMALEELDRVRYQPHIARCAQFLVDNQMQNGQWSYGQPSAAVDAIRVEGSTATAAVVRPGASMQPRPKPRVVQKISVRPTRMPSGNGDFSNSSYAALGLRACVDAGIVVPKEVLVRASQAISLAQLAASSKKTASGLPPGREPRGWCYDSPCSCPNHRPYGSMTAGALSALAIYDHLLGRDAKKDAAILDGLAWLQVNYAIDTDPGPIEFDKVTKNTFVPYYLYALERAMILTGSERVGTHAWYAEGVRYLLQNQKPDGSWVIDDWGRDTWDTCFALLFLKRSTRPLVASADRLHADDEKK